MVVRRDVPEESGFDEVAYAAELDVFLAIKDRIAEQQKLANSMRDKLMAVVEEFGEEDERKHKWLVLPDGRKIQRQCREARVLDEDVAYPLLKEKAPECVVMVEAIDEDAVMAALYTKKLTDADLQQMWKTTYSWAFVPKSK